MISVTNLSLSYGNQVIFDDISFNISSKERIGLVGRNGSGKTTIFNLLNGTTKPDSGQITIPKNYTIGTVNQHIKFTKPTVLEEGCLGLKKEDQDESWRVEKILSGLGFSEEDMSKDPHLFSGGFQVRLNLAKVLVAEPTLLLLDEPTNYLDIVSIRWLTRFLKAWKTELIIITHDRSFMDSISTHTMIVHRKKIKKISGQTQKLYDQIAQEEEIHEKTRLNDEKMREKTEAYIERFKAKASFASMAQSRVKALEKKEVLVKLEKLPELDFSFNSIPFPAKKFLQVNNISFGYTKEKQLIQNFSLEIAKEDRICVIGKNGKGKSTLLKLLWGEISPNQGEIILHPKTEMAYFGQTNIDRLDKKNTIEEELLPCTKDLNRRQVRNICGVMMFSGDLAEKKISVLSGGEKSRVLLGKLLLTPANLLLLDEPTNHLDMESCDSLIEAVQNFDGAAVIVTHNEDFLHTLANRLVVFNDDKVFVFEGTYQEFLDQIGWEPLITSQKPKPTQTTAPTNTKDLNKLKNTTLNPIEKKIKETEYKIKNHEKKLATTNQKIIELSEQKNNPEIAILSIEVHNLNNSITILYNELDSHLKEHEEKTRYFQELMAQNN